LWAHHATNVKARRLSAQITLRVAGVAGLFVVEPVDLEG
jgi:hypothetical protein